MKLLIQTLLTSLIMVKIVLGSLFIYQIEFAPIFTEPIAIASEIQKVPEGAIKVVEKNPDTVLSAPAGETGEFQSGGEETIDLSLLKKQREGLKEKERYLEKRERQLVALQSEINDKIDILTRLRNEIRAEIAKKKTDEEKKIRHLIKIYSAMKPMKAAGLLEKIDIKLAIELLSKMKGDTVGSILSFVDVEKAAKISEGLLKK